MAPLYNYNADCLKAIDGDTIDCEIDLGFHTSIKVRFRLARVNAAEMNSPDPENKKKAEAAKEYTRSVVEGKSVRLTSKKTDIYGRWIAEVTYKGADGKMINLSDDLLAKGLVEKYVGGV
jgi:micrococcal nuclease